MISHNDLEGWEKLIRERRNDYVQTKQDLIQSQQKELSFERATFFSVNIEGSRMQL
jgi:hypothetical protein